MPRRTPQFANALSLLAAFVAASMVCGLLAAGIAMPFAYGAGETAKGAVGTFDALPSELTAPVLAQQIRILARDTKTVLGTLMEQNRTVVPLSAISPVMRKAQIAIEDDRFYEHGGVDTRGLIRAFAATMRGEKQGASTITQQYVRQALVADAQAKEDVNAAAAAQARNGIGGAVRKLQEAKFAIELEKKKSKDEILEGYLNMAYYGGQSYGVEAAAKHFFDVSAKDLTLPQAALLAGLVQQPSRFDPDRAENIPAATNRRAEVLDRMVVVGAVTKAEADAAKQVPVASKNMPIQKNCQASPYTQACEFIKSWLLRKTTIFGEGSEQAREYKLLNGPGLTIQTTLDADLIQNSRKILTDWIPSAMSGDSVPKADRLGTAAATVEPGTGRVLSIATSAGPGAYVNWSVDGDVGGGSTGFAIGSTAKTYAVVQALKKGMNASTMIDAPPGGSPAGPYDAFRCDSGSNDAWNPANVEGTRTGWMTLGDATKWSVNTAFTALAEKIGVCDTKALMADMGLHQADGKPYGGVPNAIILGSEEASPLTLAASYATLAAGGLYCAPYPIESITTLDGKKLDLKTQDCRQTSVSPKVAYDTTQILRAVVPPNNLSDGRQSAAKTGTNDNSSRLWMAGYTPQRATAVWSGRPDGNATVRDGLRLPNKLIDRVYGSSVSGPSWAKIMDAAHSGLPIQPFAMVVPKQDGKVKLPDLKGMSKDEATQALAGMGLKVDLQAQHIAVDGLSWDQVAGSEPAAGAEVKEGDTVRLTLASGQWNNGNNGGGNNRSGNNGGGNNRSGNNGGGWNNNRNNNGGGQNNWNGNGGNGNN